MTKHPAKFHPNLISAIAPWVQSGDRVLDPFAGVGTIHHLRNQRSAQTWGIEVEREWAAQSPFTLIGDSRFMPFKDNSFRGVVTSPVFGNRMSDHHNAQDKSRRITYRHYLGHELHEANAGRMQWGKKYRDLHEAVWAECARVLVSAREGGYFILNCKNHIRKGTEVDVTGWHVQALESLGFTKIYERKVETPGHREGRNHSVRVGFEYIIVFTSPELN